MTSRGRSSQFRISAGGVLDLVLGLQTRVFLFLFLPMSFGCLDSGIVRSFEMGILGKMEDLESGKQVMTDQIKRFLAYIDRTVNFLFCTQVVHIQGKLQFHQIVYKI